MMLFCVDAIGDGTGGTVDKSAESLVSFAIRMAAFNFSNFSADIKLPHFYCHILYLVLTGVH